MRSIRRNHVHGASKRSKPMTLSLLYRIKSKLRLTYHKHAVLWAIITTAFHTMARMGELVPTDNSRLQQAIRLHHLRIENTDDGPLALITLPTSKIHDPNIEATLSIWASRSDVCPWKALKNYLRIRLKTEYAAGSDALWCLENGHVIDKHWVTEALNMCLPGEGITGHSFRSGGATYYAANGTPKWVIQRLGRWTSQAFETYIRTNPTVLVSFAKTALRGRQGMGQ